LGQHFLKSQPCLSLSLQGKQLTAFVINDKIRMDVIFFFFFLPRHQEKYCHLEDLNNLANQYFQMPMHSVTKSHTDLFKVQARPKECNVTQDRKLTV
jgi:hypothetical protein